MSPPQRFTFISDATNEFPNNKNNSFKVRLPTQLQLTGDNWYASLWSMSVPDEAFTSKFMFGDVTHAVDIAFTLYKLSNYQSSSSQFASINVSRRNKKIPMTDVLNNTRAIHTGVDFWKNVVDAIDKLVQDTLYSKIRG